MAFRSNPGLDLASHVLAGEAVIVGVQEFRFSRADIVELFQGELSRRELVAAEEQTAGWPVALMVHRNMRASQAAGRGAAAAKLTENYIGVRLLRDLSEEDRACLLDLAVFDWLDTDLVNEVLWSSDAMVRAAGLPALDGLLLPVGRDHTVRRLHPLLRDYCLSLFSVEGPARRRSLHQRLALALAGRGHLTPAWRHAADAGDRRLVGELIERFGVFELWLREGVTRLISAARFLTPEIMSAGDYPRSGRVRSKRSRTSCVERGRRSESVQRPWRLRSAETAIPARREIQQRTLQSMAEVRAVWADVYATAIAVTAERCGHTASEQDGRRREGNGLLTKPAGCGGTTTFPVMRTTCWIWTGSPGARWRLCLAHGFGCWSPRRNGLLRKI